MSAPLLLIGMYLDTDFITAAGGALRKVLQACQLYLIPPFLSVALLYTVGRGYLQGGQLRMDFSPLLKALFVYFILFFYREFMDLIGEAIGGFSSLVAPAKPGFIAKALQRLTNPAGATAIEPNKATNTAGFVILYCMVPWLTSFLIGSSAVQGFVGVFGGVVAGAAGAVSCVVFPGFYGGGASGALGRKLGFGPDKGGSSSGGGTSNAPSGSASANLPTMSSADSGAPTRRRR